MITAKRVSVLTRAVLQHTLGSMIDQLIKDTQSRMMMLYGRDHYYTQQYVVHERDYWGDIPVWLELDMDHTRRSNRTGIVSILDIGPGWGTLSAVMAQLYGDYGKVLGIDRHPLMIDEVRREFNIGYSVVDIERDLCPRAPYGWDVILMTEVLEHFNFQSVPTLMKIKEQLAPNGRIYLSTPDASAGWGRVYLYNDMDHLPKVDTSTTFSEPPWIDGHVWQYTKEELSQVLDKAGLKVVRSGNGRSAGGGHQIYCLTHA